MNVLKSLKVIKKNLSDVTIHKHIPSSPLLKGSLLTFAVSAELAASAVFKPPEVERFTEHPAHRAIDDNGSTWHQTEIFRESIEREPTVTKIRFEVWKIRGEGNLVVHTCHAYVS
ncbi:hypothetical protein PoB_005278500 [Plakobranchus ocellatus]|uniref:Uncharacterized protein n=1 Tax=Plakobranchus ocellatus TaxID=259542 RepID=A0AAV4C4H0_9GAST|nr:hypothetical protein PoB_005278500 [Plakobranchus ocellatus]